MDTRGNLFAQLVEGDRRALAKAITLVENNLVGAESLLEQLDPKSKTPIIGITGPPGAGKSTLINALIHHLLQLNLKVGVLAIDPTSPFNLGALLGDRVRMSDHFMNDRIFIRSLASRGSLGGLSAKAIEITELMKSAGFDLILIETVGVGQSEIEIVGLADCTILVLVPEAGDEVQGLKSGVMEIADIFVVNKADRPGAATFLKNLNDLKHGVNSKGIVPPILRAVATKNEGIPELFKHINYHLENFQNSNKSLLLVEKVYQLIQNQRMSDLNKKAMQQEIQELLSQDKFQLHQYAKRFYK